MLFLPMVAGADDAVEVGGIWYNLIPKGKVATVARNPYGNYSGKVVIPATFTYNEVDYSVASIGSYAFYDCSDLTSVTIPNSVKSIGEAAFQKCLGLTSVSIPNSVTSIGKYAFDSCSGLSSFVIPNGITSIEGMTFSGCSGLTSVTIPNSVTSIKIHAFAGCTSLTSVTIPNSVVSIGQYAFGSCFGLTSVTIPNSVTSLGESVFASCKGLTSLAIGNGVMEISESAFSYCSSLTSVTIPNSVMYIERSAFSNCRSLSSVIIGSGIEGIYSNAFGYCPELADVYCWSAEVPEMRNSNGESGATDAFQGSDIEYATLHVPAASIDAYKAVEPWKSFMEIKPLAGGEQQVQKCATPTIAFRNGKLTFSCKTEGVEFVSEVTADDAGKHYSNEVVMGGKYKVTVYATKVGWENSDVATLEFSLGSGGKSCDVNKDGTVDVADIATIISVMAAEARLQEIED